MKERIKNLKTSTSLDFPRTGSAILRVTDPLKTGSQIQTLLIKMQLKIHLANL